MKKILSAVCFFLIVLGLFHAANVMLFEKQHFGTAKNIAHEDAEKIDVFFIGASHIFYGVNPMVVWDESGIAGYNLTTHQQPLWSSKLLLQYALEHQHPKLIVLDVLMATNFSRPLLGTDQGTNMTHLALDPVPLSFNKIKGVLSTDAITEKGEILFPIILSHSRLQQGLLTWDDFHFFSGDRSHPTKGYNYTENTIPYERPAVIPEPDVTNELPSGLEEILIDFIGFCQEKDLPLLFIKTPLVGNEELYGQINHIGSVAEQYGVPFVDFNQRVDEIGLDFAADFADSGHLNVRGAGKVSRALAAYLKENYDLPDRRGSEGWESWDRASRHFAAVTGLPGSADLMDQLAVMDDPDLLTVILSGGAVSEPVPMPENAAARMRETGLSDVPESLGKGTYYAVIKGGRVLMENRTGSGVVTNEFMVRDTRFALRVSSREPDGGSFMTALYIDQGGYSSIDPGLLVVTYDTDRMETISAVRYAFDGSMTAEQLR